MNDNWNKILGIQNINASGLRVVMKPESSNQLGQSVIDTNHLLRVNTDEVENALRLYVTNNNVFGTNLYVMGYLIIESVNPDIGNGFFMIDVAVDTGALTIRYKSGKFVEGVTELTGVDIIKEYYPADWMQKRLLISNTSLTYTRGIALGSNGNAMLGAYGTQVVDNHSRLLLGIKAMDKPYSSYSNLLFEYDNGEVGTSFLGDIESVNKHTEYTNMVNEGAIFFGQDARYKMYINSRDEFCVDYLHRTNYITLEKYNLYKE